MTFILKSKGISFENPTFSSFEIRETVFDPYYIRELYRYDKLKKDVLVDLDTYLNHYSRAELESLKNFEKHLFISKFLDERGIKTDINALTINDKKNIIYPPTFNNKVINSWNEYALEYKKIYNTDNDIPFTTFVDNTLNVIDGLEKTVNQYIELEHTKNKVRTLEEILSDENKIIEYINNLKNNAFEVTAEFSVQALIKPWFRLYLELHGPPIDGVFEAEHILEIVKILMRTKNDGTRTQWFNENQITDNYPQITMNEYIDSMSHISLESGEIPI